MKGYIFDYQIVSNDEVYYAHLHTDIPQEIDIQSDLEGRYIEIRLTLYSKEGKLIDMYRKHMTMNKTYIKHILTTIPTQMLAKIESAH